MLPGGRIRDKKARHAEFDENYTLHTVPTLKDVVEIRSGKIHSCCEFLTRHRFNLKIHKMRSDSLDKLLSVFFAIIGTKSRNPRK